VKHFERMFLLEEAWFLWDETLDAEAEGDEFIPSDTFVELDDHKLAKARIVRSPAGEPVMALVLRGYDEASARAAANGFFDGAHELGFLSGEDWCFVTKNIPTRLRSPIKDPGGSK